MKIVDVCLGGSYNIGWGYQDNLISKYQVKNGHEVTLITSRFINDKNSENYLETDAGVYEDNGVKVIRLEHGLTKYLTRKLRHYKGLYKTLEEEKPDFLFVHCCQFVDVLYVCKYLKNHPNVKCVVDGHADYTNTATHPSSYFLHKTLWKYLAHRIDKYASKFYGVLPIRADFIHEMYGIDESKIDLLVMGADDELLEDGLKNRDKTRNELGIKDNELMILTGGKIDAHKTETLTLMDVINDSKQDIKLIIFGSVATELKDTFNGKLSDKIKYIGWINQERIYEIIGASDLGYFPGRHSVIWEQMVASGTPCVFRKLPRTDHIDIGGNCILLEYTSCGGIKEALDYCVNKDNYKKMKKAAMSNSRYDFLYSKISEKAIKDNL